MVWWDRDGVVEGRKGKGNKGSAWVGMERKEGRRYTEVCKRKCGRGREGLGVLGSGKRRTWRLKGLDGKVRR